MHHSIIRLFLILVLVFASQFSISGQTKKYTETTLKVAVVDQRGAAIARAGVSISGSSDKPIQLATNSSGAANFSKLIPGDYRVRVEARGFATHEAPLVEIHTGANQVEIQLEIAPVEEGLVVDQSKQESATDRRGAAFSSVLTAEQIAQLPDDPDEMENVLRQMAGPGATFRVNGFRGGKLPPKSQIREIRFRMNPYAAENHESGFIGVDITTKPGIDFWHGSINAGFRDESLNARNPAAPYRAPEQTRRFAFDFSGPIWRNRTSLFLSTDGANEYDSKTIVAELPSGRFNDVIVRPARRLNLAARGEHALNKTHTVRAEFQRNVNRRDNLGAGDFDLAERGYSTDSVENLFRLADSGAIGKSLFNEVLFQTRWLSTGIDSLSDAIATIVQNSFNSGGAQIGSSRRLTEVELGDNLDFVFGKHVMRAGVLFEMERIRSNEMRNASGTFSFGSLGSFNQAIPIIFSRRVGDGRVAFNQYQLGWYLQDDTRLKKSLSLNFGIRHELQSTISDRNNFAPRLGVAWSPFKDGKTTFRAGTGMFFDWFASEIYEQSLRVDGIKQRDQIVRNPGYPNPIIGEEPILLPPSRIEAASNLRQPSLLQASIGVERQLPGELMLRANYTYQRGLHLLRGRNLNAPFADGSRPNPVFGNVTQTESSANSFNNTLNLHLSRTRPGRFFVGLNYFLSRSISEADAPTSLPVDNRNLRGERGPSLSDARHRFFLFSNFTLWRGLRAGATLQASSAAPYNITTGFDDNGDTVINDRPAGIGRNSARGAGRRDVSIRFSYGHGWGTPKESAATGGPQVRILRGGEAGEILGQMGSMPGTRSRFRMEYYIQAFNALNHANPTTFSGVQSSAFYGLAIAALPGRRIETGVRFNF